MNVLMFSPGFPAEMPFFTRGLAAAGAKVVGVGDQPEAHLPEMARAALHGYLRLERLWDEDALLAAARRVHDQIGLDRVECLWEPGMLLAAQLREALALPGMTVAETVPFRDKEAMKRVLDAAGLRTPRHRRCATARAVREAAAEVGYPLVVKPIAGAGSADTHRVDDGGELERVLERVRHVPEVSVEEYIDGEELTYDTICRDGHILHESISWYRPRPLLARTLEWVSPQTVCLNDLDRPELAAGRALGRGVLAAFGFQTGFTHMEWFRRPDGGAVFGEIAARPPGAKSVDIMNFSCDADFFTGWAEAVVNGSLGRAIERPYNAAVIFKRARGSGRIRGVEGLARLLARFAEEVAAIELLPLGAHRRDWKQTLLSDGWVFVRHPDLETTLAIADRFGTDLELYAS